jgi:regulatory protein
MEKTGSQKAKNNSENAPYREALSRAMALCASREYCSDDIRIKLNLWGLDKNNTISVINTLIEEKFIDDKRYAEAFVKDRFRYNKWGRIKIAAMLRAKRIDNTIIDEALAVLDEDDYRRSVSEIITSHRAHIKAKNRYDLKGKLMRYGLSKGFESQILYDILDEIL